MMMSIAGYAWFYGCLRYFVMQSTIGLYNSGVETLLFSSPLDYPCFQGLLSSLPSVLFQFYPLFSFSPINLALTSSLLLSPNSRAGVYYPHFRSWFIVVSEIIS